MKTTVLAVAFLSLLALPGEALAVGDVVTLAEAALSDRIPVTTDKREAKLLGKALSSLEAYRGVNDKADLRALTRAVKKIVAGRSPDADVMALPNQFRIGLSELSETERYAAMEAYTGPQDEKDRKKVAKRVHKAWGRSGAAEHHWRRSPGKGAKTYQKAILGFQKARALAEKLTEPGSNHLKVCVFEGTLWNFTDRTVEIINVIYSVSGKIGGQPFSDAGGASSRLPGLFPRGVAPGQEHAVYGYVWEAVDALGLPERKPGDYLKGNATAVTSVGDFPFVYQ